MTILYPEQPADWCTMKTRNMERILVIDDDVELCTLVSEYLQAEGFIVEAAHDGESGLQRTMGGGYLLVVLDVMLPGINGFEVLRRIRAKSRVPVLMLTARGDDQDRILGLELGADDYLPKPFDFPVLVARIGALARRAQPATPPVLEHDDLVLDTAQRRVSRAGRPIVLAPKEFGVLELLLASHGRSVSAEELLARVWDEAADPFTNAVKITISRLRAKLGDPPIIETVAKSGYRI